MHMNDDATEILRVFNSRKHSLLRNLNTEIGESTQCAIKQARPWRCVPETMTSHIPIVFQVIIEHQQLQTTRAYKAHTPRASIFK